MYSYFYNFSVHRHIGFYQPIQILGCIHTIFEQDVVNDLLSLSFMYME